MAKLAMHIQPDQASVPNSAGRTGKERATDRDASDNRLISMKKIIMYSADDKLSKNWLDAVDGLGSSRAVYRSDDLLGALDSGHAEIALVDLEHYPDDYRLLPEQLFKQYPDTAFIILSSLPNEREGLFLITQGARGYCNRLITGELLRKAVEVVHMGEIWLGRKLLTLLMQSLANGSAASEAEAPVAKLAELTERELEITHWIAQGDSNKVIANRLGITERTVKAHLSSIFRKTGARDRLQLALLVR